MVDILLLQTVSILVTSAGLLIAALYYVLQIRHQTKIRQTDLLVRLCSTMSSKDWMEAWGRVWAYDMTTTDLEKLWTENRLVDYNIVVMFFEELGILVQMKLLDIDHVEKLLHGYAKTLWERLKPVTMEVRKTLNDPRLGEEWEYLYNEMKKREQKLQQPKVWADGLSLRFEARCDLEEFREYLKRSGYDGDLDYYEKLVVKDPARLIVWKENDKIVGHAVWHESNCEEHSKGSPRDKEDTEALRKLLGKKKGFVELHEWWLIKNRRGKGYGNQFLDFFEAYMKSKGYADLVFYGDHPAALAAFRRHGYREGGYLKGPKEYIFCHSLEQETLDNTSPLQD